MRAMTVLPVARAGPMVLAGMLVLALGHAVTGVAVAGVGVAQAGVRRWRSPSTRAS